ncbi:TPA: cupin domain-containing protein [Yersinia enterocolitica]|nr:cupin domain-containing protein [Yersinia enterocolitica]HDL7822625.1 cupin domain-containing protein [Yersinia enterocolitica]HDL7830598.1 cupin domain-containing protein [Yersinia enterocolitica]HDL7871454.1 cupin domain-containing protein [Yersinia enterocolitica]HDL7883996.1 cupin domain-containing protein [Yersinia enterocolitica]
MMIFSNFGGNKIKEDHVVGISIIEMFKKKGLQAYGTIIDQGKYVGCHSHTEGEEWYIILSGEGSIWTADVIEGILKNHREDKFSKGSVFCIYPNTAHQLTAKTTVEFVFLCPESHITDDRYMFENIFR